jgi:hypothetical protein
MKEKHEAASSDYGYLDTIAKIDGLVDVRVLIHLARQAVHQVVHVASFASCCAKALTLLRRKLPPPREECEKPLQLLTPMAACRSVRR